MAQIVKKICLQCGRTGFYPWSGRSPGVGCHSLLHGIFPTKGSNPRLPALQADPSPSEPPNSPKSCEADAQVKGYGKRTCLTWKVREGHFEEVASR